MTIYEKLTCCRIKNKVFRGRKPCCTILPLLVLEPWQAINLTEHQSSHLQNVNRNTTLQGH